jgi:Arc/MetJ family transcription regulator
MFGVNGCTKVKIFLVILYRFNLCVYLLKFIHMRTNIDINDDLLSKAQKITNSKTKKATIENALQLVVTLENQKKLIDLWGKVEIDDKAYL